MKTVFRNVGLFAALCLSLVWNQAALAQFNEDVLNLQRRWAEVNYLAEGKAQLAEFESLIEQAGQVTASNGSSAEAWIWSGIIKSSYAGAKGGLGALSAAKAAKADLEKGLALNPQAMNGSANTSLGVLYLNVPGWPLGFGDEEKGEELILKGLAIAPADIDNNYFYAEYLLSKKNYAKAELHLMKAMAANPRPGRALADEGRRGDIEKLLKQLEKAR